MDTGSCYSCGFLSKHCPGRNVPTPRFFEVEQYERNDGKMFEHTVSYSGGPMECYPVCYRNATESGTDFLIFQDPAGRDAKRAIEVINKPRNCSKWYQYMPGVDPAAHFMDLKMNELEQRRQEFEQRLEKDRRDFDIKLFEMGQRINARSEASNKRVNGVLIFFAVVQIVLAALQAREQIMQIWGEWFHKATVLYPPI